MPQKSYIPLDLKFTCTSQVPIDRDLFYRCDRCGGVIPSTPKGNIHCECRSLIIDVDYHRLCVDDLRQLTVLKRV